MVVKFIITTDGQIFFGSSCHTKCLHSDIAKENLLDKKKIVGGGLADLINRVIFGTSYGFGAYKTEDVQRILPDWSIQQPSDY